VVDTARRGVGGDGHRGFLDASPYARSFGRRDVLVQLLHSRRATTRIRPPRNGDPSLSAADLLDAFRSGSGILAVVLVGFGENERVFHPSGLADRTGWIGMACSEILVHTADVTRVVAGPKSTIDSLTQAVVDRVLPCAPREFDGWDRLMWATGRSALGEIPPEPADWWWQSAPLTEWDGRPRRRTSPPQW